MEKAIEQIGNVVQDGWLPSNTFVERRMTLTRLYHSLPAYGSPAFWLLLGGCQEEAIPLEVLVKVLREAIVREDKQTELRLFEIILARLQTANERWVSQVIARTRFLVGEQRAVAADLYADLCELLLRLLRDPQQRFWEEGFQHSLRFARKHVYEHFMRYEGHLREISAGSGRRVPHTLVESLERCEYWGGSEQLFEVCDERAEEALRMVEQEEDIAAVVVQLPARLRAVIWLIFWEDLSVKAVSELLHVSDHTVRNRLRAALAELREAFADGQEKMNDPGK